MKKKLFVIVIAILLSLSFFLWIDLRNKADASSQNGRALYQTYCMSCHGSSGKGDGELAYALYPKPRDLTRGMFKLRSTPSGQLPTDEDLKRTVRRGMPGTAMPSFYFLSSNQIDAIVQYIKEFSPEFKTHKSQPVPVPDPLPYSPELVEKGKEMYAKLGCIQCHGALGKGDGPSSTGMKDGWGYPIRPQDFTRGTYLGGGDPRDLYLRFVTGLNGTPMPSYQEVIEFLGKTEEERQQLIWGLVYYVKSLETPEAAQQIISPPPDGIISVTRASGWQKDEDLLDPYHPNWDRLEVVSIPLSRLWKSETTNSLSAKVRAVRTDHHLAILLEWMDETLDANSTRVQEFQDGAAIQFSLTGVPVFTGMGQKKGPCNIWYWRSEWQARKDASRQTDVRLAYTRWVSDADTRPYPAELQEDAKLAGRDVLNPVSLERINSPVEDLIAQGAGTLTSQPPEQQNVYGKGAWDGRRWRVVFFRTLQSDDGGDIQLKKNGSYPVAFAIWNGSQKDRNGQKFVSTWYTLKVGE